MQRLAGRRRLGPWSHKCGRGGGLRHAQLLRLWCSGLFRLDGLRNDLGLFLRRRDLPERLCGLCKGRLHDGLHVLPDGEIVLKAHLQLVGVHVDVHGVQRHGEVEHAIGVFADHYALAAGVLHRGGQLRIADAAAVDKEILIVSVSARKAAHAHIAADARRAHAALKGQHARGHLSAVQHIDDGAQVSVAHGLEHGFAVVDKAHGDVGPRKRELRGDICHIARLRRGAL